MTIIIMLLIFITLYKCEFVKEGINEDYISIRTTKIINGIFVIFVFLSHSNGYIAYSNSWIDSFGSLIILNIGQLMVTTFLFFSGYGIYESIKAKKQEYIDAMPKKRILSTLIKFDIAVLVFLIVSFIVNIKYDIRTILLSFIGWEGIGNSNWYIFAIIFLYLITYIIFKFIKLNDNIKIGIVTLFTILYMLLMSKFKESWWYDTVLCYPLGMWFSLYKSKIETKFNQKPNLIYIALIISIITFIFSFSFRENIYIYSTIHITAFIACILLFSMKVKLNSGLLNFMGNNVFYIYIYQRVPMIILDKYNMYFENRYIFLILSFLITIGITILINKINKALKNRKIEFNQKIFEIKDGQRIFEKLSNFYDKDDIAEWSKKACLDINDIFKKHQIYDFKVNTNSYMGIVIDCKSKKHKDVFVKIVPPMLDRFEKEIGTLKLLPKNLTCEFYEIDYDKKAIVMEKIKPGKLVEFYENQSKLKEMFNELNENKIHIDTYISENFKDFSEIVKKDYLISKTVDHRFSKQVDLLYDEFVKLYNKISNNVEKFLLHGDIYKNNMVLSKNGIKLIDPLGFKAPFVMELVSICAYKFFYNDTNKTNKDILNDFIIFFSDFVDEKTYKDALFCELTKVFIPSTYEANDGGIRAEKWLNILKELYPNKLCKEDKK